MYKVTCKITGEEQIYNTVTDCELFVKIGVRFMNEQPERFGITRRATKRDFTIEEV